ncbi:alcohol dehydrogenase catalytic domain-containing protein [Streptomyces sp. NPDC050481]|uniref:alcohol dehydrogenase catalytic domain-containing protein n=1 Tax=Streptomyces sp. NPDC050481 TaxID=3365616 RepID=UPI0037A967C3
MPEPGSGQVRIRVASAAVNPVHIQTRSGGLTASGLLPEPEITGLGWDVAGTVDALEPHVVGFRPGDPVIDLSDRLALSLKAQAEYVVLDVEAVAAAPAGTDLVAAATPAAGRPHLRTGTRHRRGRARPHAAGAQRRWCPSSRRPRAAQSRCGRSLSGS